MSGSHYVDSEGLLHPAPARDQGNIYKPHNKAMAEELSEKELHDVHTKEIDLVNRDPKHLNDDVVKFPRLYNLAKCCLIIPANSEDAEHSVSVYGQVFTP